MCSCAQWCWNRHWMCSCVVGAGLGVHELMGQRRHRIVSWQEKNREIQGDWAWQPYEEDVIGGVSTSTSHMGIGSHVALMIRGPIALDRTSLGKAVYISIMSVMCPPVSRLIVSQLNQGTNTCAINGCRHFLNFRPLTVKQLSGVGSFFNSASWQNQVVGQNVRNGIDCWDVCEERLLPTCKVGQSQSERTTMPWKSSWINAMESWSCRLQPNGICSPWGKKRLKAWMTSLTGC